MFMKFKICLFYAFIFLLINGCNNKQAHISGISHLNKHTTLKLYEIKAYTYSLVDSADVKASGKFSFKVKTDEPGFYQINSPGIETINLLIDNTSQLKINIGANGKYTIEGDKNNQLLKQFYDTLAYAKNELRELEKVYDTSNANTKTKIEEKYLSLIKQHKQLSRGIIIDNLTSLIIIPVLYQKLHNEEFLFDKSKDLQFFKLAVDSLSKYYPNQRNVRALQDDFTSRLSKYNQYKIMQSFDNINAIDFPDITYNDVNGHTATLSNLKQSNVLIFFWSQNIPESINILKPLKRIYNEYSSKGFTIYAVHVGKDIDAWKYVVNNEELPWINVCDTAFNRSLTRGMFNINLIPSNVLVNPIDKTIIAKDLTINQLDSYLQDILD